MNPKPLASLNHFTVPVMRAICALLLACTVPAAGGFACAAVERRDSHNSCVRAFPETRRGPQAEAQVLEQSLVQHTAPCHGPFARPKVHHSAELSQWSSPNPRAICAALPFVERGCPIDARGESQSPYAPLSSYTRAARRGL